MKFRSVNLINLISGEFDALFIEQDKDNLSVKSCFSIRKLSSCFLKSKNVDLSVKSPISLGVTEKKKISQSPWPKVATTLSKDFFEFGTVRNVGNGTSSKSVMSGKSATHSSNSEYLKPIKENFTEPQKNLKKNWANLQSQAILITDNWLLRSKKYKALDFYLHQNSGFDFIYHFKNKRKFSNYFALILNHKQVNKKNFLITFSGGQDSITLLVLLFGIFQIKECGKVLPAFNNFKKHKSLFFSKFSILSPHLRSLISLHVKSSFFQSFPTKSQISLRSIKCLKSRISLRSCISSQKISKKNKIIPKSQKLKISKKKIDLPTLESTIFQPSTQKNLLKLNLLWNHHLWHKDSFFITRHILKLSFLFKMSTHSAIAVTSVKSELQARQWRLKTSRRVKDFYKYANVMQAHSGTDKIETLLLNLFRGTGNTSPFNLTHFRLNFSQIQKRKLFLN